MRGVGIARAGRGRRRLALAAVVCVALGVAAVVAVAAAPSANAPVLDYSAYVGGKGKAKANLSPVVLGFINGQGGPPNFNFPQATSVIEAGVKMVNAELGGVHG